MSLGIIKILEDEVNVEVFYDTWTHTIKLDGPIKVKHFLELKNILKERKIVPRNIVVK